MARLTFFTMALLSLLPAAVYAQGGFYQSCDPTTFEYNVIVTGDYWTHFQATPWLSGECLAADGSYTNSTLNLNDCLANNNGNLEWSEDGDYGVSCQCDIDQLPVLCCTCEENSNAENSGACINLDEQVAATGGLLGCPDVPTS